MSYLLRIVYGSYSYRSRLSTISSHIQFKVHKVYARHCHDSGIVCLSIIEYMNSDHISYPLLYCFSFDSELSVRIDG